MSNHALPGFESQIVVAPPNHHDIVLTRVLPAPRALVFDAWTDPEHLLHWWGPHGFAGLRCEIDLRVGGHFRLDLRGPDGIDYPCEGTYHEVVRPERIVYSGMMDDRHPCGAGIPPHSLVTVTFTDHAADATRITIHARVASTATDAIVAAGFIAGWRDAFERLSSTLSPR